MTEVAQYIDLPGVVTRVERIDGVFVADGHRYQVRVECESLSTPIVVDLITTDRPEVEQRCYVTVTFYEETP